MASLATRIAIFAGHEPPRDGTPPEAVTTVGEYYEGNAEAVTGEDLQRLLDDLDADGLHKIGGGAEQPFTLVKLDDKVASAPRSLNRGLSASDVQRLRDYWHRAFVGLQPTAPVIMGSARGRPSLWHRMGFRHRWDEALFDWRNAEPGPDDWFVPGTVNTSVRVHVDWRDRLRLLVSGRCAIEVYTRTDALVKHAESRSAFAVLPPSPIDPPGPALHDTWADRALHVCLGGTIASAAILALGFLAGPL